jgi:ferredoxin-type protein NapH
MNIKKQAKLTAYLRAPFCVVVGFTIAILVFLFALKEPGPVPIFIIFAVIQFSCMILFGILPGKGKTIARAVSMFLIGLFILVLAGILGKNNFQLEGFFFSVFSGTFSGVIVHFLMAKIIGPIIFGRNWCSWGCWTGMVLDLLPYKTNAKRYSKKAGMFRYVFFFLSFLLVAILYFGFRFTIIHTNPEALAKGIGTQTELIWFLAGNLIYYLIGIVLAIKLRDNRAFCKYICPLAVTLKLANTIAFLRIKGNSEACTKCSDCVKNCPMGIDIPAYLQDKTRVKSTECIMCMKCIANCPEAILKTSLGLDIASTEYLV